MNSLDSEFFDAYKELNKICGEELDCDNGVTEYISIMSNIRDGALYVDTWNHDLRELKRLRHIRNQIAHDTSGIAFCEDEDIDEASDFYDRFINSSDPVSIYRRKKTSIQKQEINQISTSNTNHNVGTQLLRKKSCLPYCIAFVAGLLVVGILVLTYISNL